MNKATILAAIGIASLALGTVGDSFAQSAVTPAPTASGRHFAANAKHDRDPRLVRAMRQENNALKNLEAADHDSQGHRAKAAELMRQAIAETKLAIKDDK